MTNSKPQISFLPITENNPNFMCASLKFEEKKLNIIGTRIRIGSGNSQEALNKDFKERKKQFDNLLMKVLKEIEGSTIVIGDFNNGYFDNWDTIDSYKGKARQYYSYPLIKQEIESIGYLVHTPKGHSWEHRGGKYQLDHFLCKGCKKVLNLNYDWSFTLNPQYCHHDRVGYPDHAILSADVILE